MTTSLDVLEAVVGIVKAGNTDAQKRVFTPGNWPTSNNQYPAILVRLISEHRVSLGRSAPKFTVTATIQFAFRTAASTTDFVGDGYKAEMDGWKLKQQVDLLLINNPAIFKMLQQVPETRAQATASNEGNTTNVEVLAEMDFEFFQDTSDFFPIASQPLNTASFTLPDQPPSGLTIDLTA